MRCMQVHYGPPLFPHFIPGRQAGGPVPPPAPPALPYPHDQASQSRQQQEQHAQPRGHTLKDAIHVSACCMPFAPI
jgi:hypothetical protein